MTAKFNFGPFSSQKILCHSVRTPIKKYKSDKLLVTDVFATEACYSDNGRSRRTLKETAFMPQRGWKFDEIGYDFIHYSTVLLHYRWMRPDILHRLRFKQKKIFPFFFFFTLIGWTSNIKSSRLKFVVKSCSPICLTSNLSTFRWVLNETATLKWMLFLNVDLVRTNFPFFVCLILHEKYLITI